MAVLGIAQYFCVHLGGGYNLCFSQEPQPLALIGNPAFLSAYLLLCAGATLLLTKRWWYWIIPMGFCLVLCRTRGLWLGVAVAIIVGLIIYWLDKRNMNKPNKKVGRPKLEDWKKKNYVSLLDTIIKKKRNDQKK